MFKCKSIVLCPEDVERFHSLIDRSGGPDACWPWLGTVSPEGYGQFKSNRATFIASRVAHVLSTGEQLGSFLACHKCDNPSCCNPAHLFPGTHKDNHDDMKRKGRGPVGDRNGTRTHPESFTPDHYPRGEEAGNARLTNEQIEQIRGMCVIADGKCINASEIAEKFGIRRETVHRIRTRKTWSHL